MVGRVIAGEATHALVNADARAALPELPDACAQLVLTDPPYNLGIPYPDYDDRLPWPDYWRLCDEVIAQCARILRPGGVLAALLPFTSYDTIDGPIGHNRKRAERRRVGAVVPILAEWTARTQAAGLLYEDTIAVVHSFDAAGGEGHAIGTAIGGSSRPRMRSVARALLVCFAGRRAVPDRDGRWGWGDESYLDACKNYWLCRPGWGQGFGHPAPMPPLAAARAIRLWSNRGDLVVDPFSGSGTVAAEAVREERRAIGMDVSPTAHNCATLRLSQPPLLLDPAREVAACP